MKKKIYAVLLLTAVCAGSGVFAQSSAPKENLEKYYTLERIRSKSGWLVSDNAAGLMLNQASLSIAEVMIMRLRRTAVGREMPTSEILRC